MKQRVGGGFETDRDHPLILPYFTTIALAPTGSLRVEASSLGKRLEPRLQRQPRQQHWCHHCVEYTVRSNLFAHELHLPAIAPGVEENRGGRGKRKVGSFLRIKLSAGMTPPPERCLPEGLPTCTARV